MIKPARFSLVLVFLAAVGLGQEKQPAPPEFKIPPEEVKRENPVKSTPASIAEGKRLYGYDCAMCHGKDGDGKGDLVVPMGLKIRDFRDPATLKDLTDGGIFYILTNGRAKMPGDNGRMRPEQRWHMVNFIRSLATKEVVTKAKEEKPN